MTLNASSDVLLVFSLLAILALLPHGEACFGPSSTGSDGNLVTSKPAVTTASTTAYTGTFTFTTFAGWETYTPEPRPDNFVHGARNNGSFRFITIPFWPQLPPIDLTGFGEEDVLVENPTYETLCYQTDGETVFFDCNAYVSGAECPVGTLSDMGYVWKRSQPTNELLRYYNKQCGSVQLNYIRCISNTIFPAKFPKCRLGTDCLPDEHQVPAGRTFESSEKCANFYAMIMCYHEPTNYALCLSDISQCTEITEPVQPETVFSFTLADGQDLDEKWESKWWQCQEYQHCDTIDHVNCINLEYQLSLCRPVETGGCVEGDIQITPKVYPTHFDCAIVDWPYVGHESACAGYLREPIAE